MACRDYHTLYGRPYTILRYGIPYGPRMRDNCVVAAFFKRAHARRAVAHRRRRAPAAVLRLRRGPRRRPTCWRSSHVAENRDVQHRRTRSRCRSGDRGVGADAGRRRLGRVRTVAPRRSQGAGRRRATGRATSSVGHPRTRSPRACAGRTPGTSAPEPRRPPARTRPSVADDARRIAVVPAYNEEPTVAAVLDKLYPLVDELVVVDDGSTDRTRAEIEAWLPGHDHAAAARRSTRTRACRRRTTSRSPTCAGGCTTASSPPTTRVHGRRRRPARPRRARRARAHHHRRALDALLVRRDLSTYPPYKQRQRAAVGVGDAVGRRRRCTTSSPATGSSGSGRSPTRSTTTAGYKYTETVEVAVVHVPARLHVRNDVLVPVPVYPKPHADGGRVHRPRRHSHGGVPGGRPPSAAARGARACGPSPSRGHSPRRADRPSRRSSRRCVGSAPVEVAGAAEQVVEPHRLETLGLQPVDDSGSAVSSTERSA